MLLLTILVILLVIVLIVTWGEGGLYIIDKNRFKLQQLIVRNREITRKLKTF